MVASDGTNEDRLDVTITVTDVDEELGIWTADGALVAEVDWDEGQAREGMSFARVPDAIGEFQTVGNPTPGASNQTGN